MAGKVKYKRIEAAALVPKFKFFESAWLNLKQIIIKMTVCCIYHTSATLPRKI
jgi:hypothetical protein